MPTAAQTSVLLVEDDDFLAQMYAAKLNLDGFIVQTAGDGEKAVRLAKEKQPDIVLLDLLLPKKNGFEVLAELKADPVTKDIPVLILSNLGQREDIERCLSLGAVDYLIKAHFVPAEVMGKIKKILGRA